MKIEEIVWNKTNYKKFINYLISIGNEDYKSFNSSIVNTKMSIIGINVPTLRKIA